MLSALNYSTVRASRDFMGDLGALRWDIPGGQANLGLGAVVGIPPARQFKTAERGSVGVRGFGKPPCATILMVLATGIFFVLAGVLVFGVNFCVSNSHCSMRLVTGACSLGHQPGFCTN